MAQGDKILASDANSIFTKLEELRAKHYSGAGQSTAAKTALSTPFESTPIVQGALAAEPYTLMKQYINTLKQSVFLASITAAQVDAITVPSAGDLIEFLNLSTTESLINTIEQMPFEYGANFSGFNATNFSGFNGTNFSGFNSANFGTNFSRFFATNFSWNGSNFSGYNGTNFSAFFQSNFTGYNVSPFCAKCFNPFTPFFSSFNSSNFTTNFSGFFSSQRSGFQIVW